MPSTREISQRVTQPTRRTGYFADAATQVNGAGLEVRSANTQDDLHFTVGEGIVSDGVKCFQVLSKRGCPVA